MDNQWNNKPPIDLNQLPNFRWVNSDKKRYYKLILSRDLLGDWIVTRVWGALYQSRGRASHIPCSTYRDAMQLIDKICKTRMKRGYTECLSFEQMPR